MTNSDALATPEIRAAMAQSERLLGLVQFPIRGESKLRPEPRVQYNWEIAAPAMLFSAASCLQSIRLLAAAPAPRREQDAIVLLRRLYEHVVDFAWISIAPDTNAKIWLADDYHHRLKVDDEFMKLGQRSLQADKRTSYEEFVKAHPKLMDLASRAYAADKHWSAKIPGHGLFPSSLPADTTTLVNVQGGYWSLRVQYPIIYRLASANAHPTALSLMSYANVDADGKYAIGTNANDHDDRWAYTFAPLIYSTMLFVSEHVLGYPKRADVEAVFESARATGL